MRVSLAAFGHFGRGVGKEEGQGKRMDAIGCDKE
jgi:hypothetical protein